MNSRVQQSQQLLVAVLLVWHVVGIHTTHGQTKKPAGIAAELDPIRLEFRDKVNQEKIPILLEYLKRLEAIELRMVERREYDGLIRLEKKRLGIFAELTSTGYESSGMEKLGAIMLSPTDARTAAGVVRDQNQNGTTILRSWRTGGSATWNLTSIEPGYYAVHIVYSSRPFNHEGEDDGLQDILRFGEVTSLIQGTADDLRFTLLPSGSAGSKQRTTSLGTIALTRNAATVRLSMEESRSRTSGVMDLRYVYLVRTARPEPDQTGADFEPEALGHFRGAHERVLQQVRTPLEQEYIEELQRLHASLKAAGQTAQANAVIDERERLKQEQVDPLALVDALKPTKPEADLLPPRTLQHCTLVGEAMSGDRLLIQSESGEEITIRLAYVECPQVITDSPRADAADINRRLARHFNAAPDQIQIIAQMAQKFTTETLGSAPFIVRMDGSQDKFGAMVAKVSVPSIGSLQQLLVSQGLAAPSQQSQQAPPDSFVGQILDAKEKAARRSLKGAWQF